MPLVSLSKFQSNSVFGTFVLLCCFENFLATAPIYGFSSILVVFKEMKLYHYLCDTTDNHLFNNTAADSADLSNTICNAQAQALNWFYMFGILMTAVTKFPFGFFVDKHGPQISQYFGCVFMILFGLTLRYAEPGKEYLVFIALFFLSIASSIFLLCVYQTVNVLCSRWKTLCICLLSGSVDASSAVFLIFLTAYESGSSLSASSAIYTAITVVFIIILTTLFFPTKQEILEIVDSDVRKQLEKRRSDTGFFEITHDLTCSYKGAPSSLFNHYKTSLQRNYDENSDFEVSRDSYRSIDASRSFQLSISYRGYEEQLSSYTYSQSINYTKGLQNKSLIENEKEPLIPLQEEGGVEVPSLSKTLFSWMNFFFVLLIAICLLKLLYFVGNLDKYYGNFVDHQTSLVYIKYFGFTQFLGVVFSPISCLFFRKLEAVRNKSYLSDKQKYIESIRACILPSLVLILMLLIIDIMQLFKVIQTSIPMFILYLSGMSLLFCFSSVFAAVAFHPKFFCTVYGFATCVSGTLSLLEYPLLTLELEVFHGNQFWTNVIFTFLLLITLSFPAYLWFHCRNEEKRLSDSEKPHCVDIPCS